MNISVRMFEREIRTLTFVVGLAFLLAVGMAGVAQGHAYMDTSTPAEGATVAEWPGEVRLTFTEPIEVRSSVFKVYPLDAEGVDNPLQLNAKARALFEQVLPLRRDEDDRFDAGVTASGATADEIAIALQEGAPAGTYVVMWRVLSVDTHVVSGYYVFHYEPEEQS